jgi:acylphosphatase
MIYEGIDKMVNKRATITILGDVQDVGYRTIVMRIGQKAGLTGYVENLPDGSVRVVCEGEESAIKDFTKKLDIHDEDIDVEEIDVEWSNPTGEFEWFTVKIIDRDMELFQGFATAGKKLSGIRLDIKDVSNKQDTMNEKLDNIGNRLGDALERYDTFGKKMISIETEMKEFTKQITRLVDHLVETKKEGN